MRNDIITKTKTPEQLDAMREGGKILASIFADIRAHVAPGMSELDVDAFAAQRMQHYGVEATYRTKEVNFPASICVSTNDEVVHGLPNEYVFEKGDIVSFDLVITHKGMKTDSAFTMMIGDQPKGAVKHLLQHTERSLYAGIDAIKGPIYTGTIGAAIEDVLRSAKLGIVRDLVGHGVGLKMHMPPDIPNWGKKGSGVLLQPGDTIAIEPMATLGRERVETLEDEWTIATHDGSLAAHFEHTVLITETGAEILTQA